MSVEDLHKLLHNRTELVQNLTTRAIKYVDLIETIISSINPAHYTEIRTVISEIQKIITELSSFDVLITPKPTDTTTTNPATKPTNTITPATKPATTPTFASNTQVLTNGVGLFQTFIALDKALGVIIDVFKNEHYAKTATYNMSATYMVNMRMDRASAINVYEKYLDMCARDDSIIINSLLDLYKINANTENAFTFVLENSNIVNKFIMKIISILVHKMSGEKRRKLELIVERQKNEILSSTRKKNNYTGVQSNIVRYGLTPASNFLPLSEIFSIIGVKYNTKITPEENLKSLPCGVVVINKYAKSPIEFDLRGLIDAKYITSNDMKTNPTSGLTKKIIERFNTTRILPKTGSPAGSLIIGTESKTRYVLENVSELYRLMSKGDKIEIPYDSIIGIFEGLSLRAEQYNNIIGEEIVSNCFDPNPDILNSYKEESMAAPSSEIIRAAVLDKITQWFSGVIKNTKITNSMEFKSKAIDKSVITVILSEVLTPGHKKSDEYLVSYITKLDSIINNFLREFERKVGIEIIPERIFSELPADELSRTLASIHKNVTKSAIDELERSGLWTSYDTSLKEYFLEKKQIIM